MKLDVRAERADDSPRGQILQLYGTMVRLRALHAAVLGLEAPESFAPAFGLEATVAATAAALGRRDALVALFQEQAFALACGSDARTLASELLRRGRDEEVRLGPEVFFDRSIRFFRGRDFVGSHVGMATALGMNDKLHGGVRNIVCAVRGEAVTVEDFRGALELAREWRLPVLFLCENNQCVPREASTDLCAGAREAGVEVEEVDGMHALALRSRLARALARLREHGGPAVIEALTFYPPVLPGSRIQGRRRTPELLRRRDPLAILRDTAAAHALATPAEFAAAGAVAEAQIAVAIAEALGAADGPAPEPNP
jgi:TPP-dependent pyruvate/acetoin dehydrogenase alpha subunit